MNENKHVVPIPPQVLEEIRSGIKHLIELLGPYAVALTPQERKELPKMGEKSVSFVRKAFELAKENPHLCPDYLNMDEFQADITDAFGLLPVRTDAVQLVEILSDIEMLAGSEAFQAALGSYGYARLLAHRDVPEAKAVYEELKKRFPGVKRKKGRETE
jgi:hypothetical protein